MHDGHRRTARGAALAGLATAGLAIAHAGPGVTAIGPVRRRLFPRLAGLGRPDHVALTFDDGPDPASTPAFLHLLAERGPHATFFLLGSMVAPAPQLDTEITLASREYALPGSDLQDPLHASDCPSPGGAASAALGALPWLLDECSARGLAVGTLAEHGLG